MLHLGRARIRTANRAGPKAERTVGRVGAGNWDVFPLARLPDIYAAAEQWADKLGQTGNPWLYWCISALQQPLAKKLGIEDLLQ